MTLRQIIALGITIGLGAWFIVQIPRVHRTLQTNKARFLANQGRWEEARRQLSRVLEKSPDDARARRLLAEVMINRRDYANALRVLANLPPQGPVDFCRALCSYELDQENAARVFFSRAIADEGNRISIPLRTISIAAVQALATSGTSELPVIDVEELQPVEQMLWHSVTGRSLFERRRFDEARDHLDAALDMQDLNRSSAFLACAANAIVGDFSRARMRSDEVNADPWFYEALADELRCMATRTTTQSISVSAATHAADNRFRLMRSSVWASFQSATDCCWLGSPEAVLASASQLLASNPDDIRSGLLRAEILETMSDLPAAYRQYRATLARRPCYAVLVRIRDLVGDAADIHDLQTDFLTAPSIAARVAATDMLTTAGHLVRGYLALYTRATVLASFDVPEAGEYYLNLVASGDRAFGLAPLLNLRLDGERLDDIYVAREGWDCYSVRKSLGKGTHRLEMEYINNSERLISAEEDRNVYIRELIISEGGAR